MKTQTITKLSNLITTYHSIIYISHFDFEMIDEIISQAINNANKIVQKNNAELVEFDNAFGFISFKNKQELVPDYNLENTLRCVLDDGFRNPVYLVLKDVHQQLDNPKIIALLKRISSYNLYKENFSVTIFIVSDIIKIPRELENFITLLDIPMPSKIDIQNLVNDFIQEYRMEVEPGIIDKLTPQFGGLNEFQIKQVLLTAFNSTGSLNDKSNDLILEEKKQFIKKSGSLEIIDFDEKIDDIGGLDTLKNWLRNKEKIFHNITAAQKFGVDIPKGIMIIGKPGCGKSLTAKATASLFNLPLIRLDIGKILGKYVGDSESNMRKALKIAEAISPCVLWIDELEKAFAGVGGDGSGNEITTRLFGYFLTWLQEKKNNIFIVATANNINKLPPEFLRKGRFDEIFYVDEPNDEVKKDILRIHLNKRGFGKNSKQIVEDFIKGNNISKLDSGAKLEQLVKNTIEYCYINKQSLSGKILVDIGKEMQNSNNYIDDNELEALQDAKNILNLKDIQRASKK